MKPALGDNFSSDELLNAGFLHLSVGAKYCLLASVAKRLENGNVSGSGLAGGLREILMARHSADVGEPSLQVLAHELLELMIVVIFELIYGVSVCQIQNVLNLIRYFGPINSFYSILTYKLIVH